jgi:hypothetical protein
MTDRELRLLAMISKATGHQIVKVASVQEEGEDVVDEDTRWLYRTSARGAAP